MKVIELHSPSIRELERTLNELVKAGHKVLFVYGYNGCFTKAPYARIIYKEGKK